MKPGRVGTLTHDYKRHSTTTLFAALDVLTGTVIGRCLPRHEEFLRFLSRIDREVPKELAIHTISRSLRDPHASRRVRPAQSTQTLPRPLHADVVLVVEPFGAMVRGANRQTAPARRVPLGSGTDLRNRALRGSAHRESETVCPDRDGQTKSSPVSAVERRTWPAANRHLFQKQDTVVIRK
jgi:hypothetical protein